MRDCHTEGLSHPKKAEIQKAKHFVTRGAFRYARSISLSAEPRERNHLVLFPGPSVVECCCRIPVLSVVTVQHFNTVEPLTFDSSKWHGSIVI